MGLDRGDGHEAADLLTTWDARNGTADRARARSASISRFFGGCVV